MDDAPAWHQALVFALTGERRPELGRQPAPDIPVVVGLVGPGPYGAHVVPADLLRGLGPARFAAVLSDLRNAVRSVTPGPVLADRNLDADERRLLGDVPPHH